jgi:hypothetical protein
MMIFLLKVGKLNGCHASTSTLEHVAICTRCKDFDVDAIVENVTIIKSLNDHVAKLESKIIEHELEYEKYKFTRSILSSGRWPNIKDGVGFQKGDKVNYWVVWLYSTWFLGSNVI